MAGLDRSRLNQHTALDDGPHRRAHLGEGEAGTATAAASGVRVIHAHCSDHSGLAVGPPERSMAIRLRHLSSRSWCVVVGIALTIPSAAQTERPGLNARDLYLERIADDGIDPSSPPPNKPQSLSANRDLKRSGAPAVGVQYLGVRYNILLFNSSGRPPQPVDPRRVFKTGDCIALELQSNRAVYLYVLSEGASGMWAPLVPSVLAPEESNVLPNARIRAPTGDCIEFTDPPGTERLFLILSRDIADVRNLLDVFRLSSLASGKQPGESGAANGDAIATLRNHLGSRDMRLKKIDKPEIPDEQPFTTYAVAPAPRLFLEIRLRHE